MSNSPPPDTSSPAAPPFDMCIHTLLNEIEGLRLSYFPISGLTACVAVYNSFSLNDFLRTRGKPSESQSPDTENFTLPGSASAEFKKLQGALQNTNSVARLLPESLLLTLVSRFDAFFGRLLRQMFLTQPNILRKSEKKLKFAQILGFANYDEVRDYVIDKETESVLRKNHADQFQWLEYTLKSDLKAKVSSWKRFVEITERRHLFVHCDGLVSRQYLSVCKEHGVSVPPSVVLGTLLSVPQDYFNDACDCFTDVAIKLTHLVWRQLLPNDREAADSSLLAAGFDLLSRDHFRLAQEIFRFGLHDTKSHSSEACRMMFAINLAQAYKWCNDDDNCKATLDAHDFSACASQFRLCELVLRDKYDDAISLMKIMGSTGGITAEYYQEWPIFRVIRNQPAFQETFTAVFGRPFTVQGTSAVSKERLVAFVTAIKDHVEPLVATGEVNNLSPEKAKELFASVVAHLSGAKRPPVPVVPQLSDSASIIETPPPSSQSSPAS